jgi:phage terminase small subunit
VGISKEHIMAGVKGRSGGARPNSGGARPGAGAKPKPKKPAHAVAAELGAEEFLTAVMLGRITPSDEQLKAATTLYGKKSTGVKDEKAEKAKKAATGKFGAAPPPLRVVNS